ncbi:hypothetical protein WN943_003314 [Citrus x changshan-huyou]
MEDKDNDLFLLLELDAHPPPSSTNPLALTPINSQGSPNPNSVSIKAENPCTLDSKFFGQDKQKKLTPEERHRWMLSNINEISTSNIGENSGASKNIEESDEDKVDGGNLLSQCRVASFSELVSSFSSDQQAAVKEIGFGSLLDLKSILVYIHASKLTGLENFTKQASKVSITLTIDF